MDRHFHCELEPELIASSSTDSVVPPTYAGSFFPHATGFVINGGVFTSNVTNKNVHTLPQGRLAGQLAFRTIPLGDINLLKEIRLDSQFGHVSRQRRRSGVRRLYAAELEGRRMTVAMYQGYGVEQEWQQHVAKYASIRHPNIMQLYGLVSTDQLHAMVFHDDLIPFNQFFCRFQHSPILTAYITGYTTTELVEVKRYFHSVFAQRLNTGHGNGYTYWIRPATGQLCLDLVQNPETETAIDSEWLDFNVLRLESVSLDSPDAENAIIPSLKEDEYHQLCSGSPMAKFRNLAVSTLLPMWPGSIIFHTKSPPQALFSIGKLLCLEADDYKFDGWNARGPDEQGASDVMADSWIRYGVFTDYLLLSSRGCKVQLPPYTPSKHTRTS
ncbi:hypothetical protein MVEN_01178900 [Mycena venus]|uniref:Protein kinase domain-containing protein n=1 Tax=Mycena venus TaxID=2733690 RepID=A0A8H6Y3S7_9AGAR|nr:hypothetical protein MVEN_01178900 [Mycena venus]